MHAANQMKIYMKNGQSEMALKSVIYNIIMLIESILPDHSFKLMTDGKDSKLETTTGRA